MANNKLDLANRFITESDDIYKYLSDEYKSSFCSRIIESGDRKCCFGPFRYVNILKYRRFSNDNYSERTFRRVIENLLNGLHSADSNFGLFLMNNNGDVRIYYGQGAESCDRGIKIENSFRDVPDIAFENSFISPSDISTKMAHCAILTGVPDNKASIVDTIADCIENTNAIVSILATPVSMNDINSYINKLDELMAMCDTYGAIQKTYGTASRQEIKEVIPSVERLKLIVDKQIKRFRGKESSVWEYCVLIGSQNESNMSEIANTISGQMNSMDPIVNSYWFKLAQKPDLLWSVPFGQYSDKALSVDMDLHVPMLTSLCTSSEISGLAHLPTKEHVGLDVVNLNHGVNERNPFSINPPVVEGDRRISIGSVFGSGKTYEVALDSLCRHMLVVGSNGSGKSTTVLSILRKIHALGIKFCVIEPDKTQYWQLASDVQELRVLTSAKTGEKLHINILEPEVGITIGTHISSIYEILSATIDMEEATKAAYLDLMEYTFAKCGWNINDTFIGSTKGKRIPTIKDLHDYLGEYCEGNLKHSSEIRGNIQGTVENRLRHLCAGDASDVLLNGRSITGKELCSRPTVVELDSLSEMSKNVISAFLIEKIYQYIKIKGESEGKLQNVVVVEEAHNIFKKEKNNGVSANATSAYLSKMLSAIRAYGTGLIIADQRTSAIDSNAVANTHIKIVHSLESYEDVEPLEMALDLNEMRISAIRRLGEGEAIVSESKSNPCLVKIEKAQRRLLKTTSCVMCIYRDWCFFSKVIQKIDTSGANFKLIANHISANRYKPEVMAQTVDVYFKQIGLPESYRPCALGYIMDSAGNMSSSSIREIIYNYCIYKEMM